MPFLTQGKTNWKFILIVVVLATVVGGVVFCCLQKFPSYKPLEIVGLQNEATELEFPRAVSASFITNGQEQLIFSNLEGEEISKVIGDDNGQIRGLEFDKFFEEPPFKVYDSAIEYSPGVFYFYGSDQVRCAGVAEYKCWWILYKYDKGKKSFSSFVEKHKDSAFLYSTFSDGGYPDSFNFSPNKKHASIIFLSSFGACCREDSIILFNFETSSFTRIDDFINRDYLSHRIDSLAWIDDDRFEIKLTEGGSYLNPEIGTRESEYKYCLSVSELELLKEEFKAAPQACLAKGAKIAMPDNNYKSIEDIKVGDLVKSFNLETKEYKDAEVIEVIKREDPIININNTLKAAPDEPIYMADTSIKIAIDLRVGDLLFNQIRVDSIKYSPDKVETYDLILKDANNFFANGYLVHTPE